MPACAASSRAGQRRAQCHQAISEPFMAEGIEVFHLQRTSSGGRTYFIKRLGSARIAVLKDDRAEVDQTTLGLWRVIVQPRERDRTALNRNDQQSWSLAKPAKTHQPTRPEGGGQAVDGSIGGDRRHQRKISTQPRRRNRLLTET
jgi:hypothetical protein